MSAALPGSFFNRHTVEVARDLVGCLLVRDFDRFRVVSRIVETEAYRYDDPASHSFRGPTARCRVMFGPPGFAYVYRSYGIHHCLNVVTEVPGIGCAVLIRALEPLDHFAELWERRFPRTRLAEGALPRMTNGPGKLTRALDITVDGFNGHDLTMPPLVIAPDPGGEKVEVVSDRRIGITKGVEALWRFYDGSSRYVSKRKPSRDT